MRICNRDSRRRGPVLAAAVVCTLAFISGTAGPRVEGFECLVEPYMEIDLSSPVPGVLEQVQVDRGDEVTRGQVVATLESGVVRASLDLAKARAEFAARRVERNEELYRKQMISIHEKDEMETEAHLLRLELREVKERLEERTVRSPLDGVVVERHLSSGEYVHQNEILTLAQIDPLRVEVAVPVRMYGAIRVGMTGSVSWEVPGVGEHPATVTVVDPVIDAASGTIGVRLELPNPQRRLPAGTQCIVRFE